MWNSFFHWKFKVEWSSENLYKLLERFRKYFHNLSATAGKYEGEPNENLKYFF